MPLAAMITAKPTIDIEALNNNTKLVYQSLKQKSLNNAR